MVVADYHTHTCYSDGKSSIKQNVEFAIKRGLKEVAITDHGYASCLLGMTDKKWKKQTKVINSISGIKVLHGIESNIFANGTIDVDGKDLSQIDVLIVGFHRLLSIKQVFKNFRFVFINGYCSKEKREKEIDANTELYIKVLSKYPIDILAHINNRTLVDVKKVCNACAKNNIYVELNAKHLDAIDESIKDMVESNCNFIISTDSHKASEVGLLDDVVGFIEKNNIPKERVFGIDKLPVFKKR